MNSDIYEPKHHVILNMENDLKFLEGFLAQVKNPPEGLYVKGRRAPFTHNEHGLFIFPGMKPLDLKSWLPDSLDTNIVDKNGKLIASGYNLVNNKHLFSNKPLHPYLAGEFLIELVELLQYINNPNKDLYYENPLNKKTDCLLRGSIRNMTFIEDLVYRTFNGLETVTIRRITDFLYKKIVPLLNEFMLKDVNAFYTINVDTPDIVFTKYNDLRTIRFIMAHEDMLMEEELIKQSYVQG